MATTALEAEVQHAVEDLFDAMNQGDAERLRFYLGDSPESVHIGTAPEEWLSANDIIEGAGTGHSLGIKAELSDLSVHPLGDDAAWIAGHAEFVSDQGNRPIRFSGAIRRADGHWVFVHSHASAAIPNDNLFG